MPARPQMTPERQAALDASIHAWGELPDDGAYGQIAEYESAMFLAGIAQGQREAASLCRDRAARYRSDGYLVRASTLDDSKPAPADDLRAELQRHAGAMAAPRRNIYNEALAALDQQDARIAALQGAADLLREHNIRQGQEIVRLTVDAGRMVISQSLKICPYCGNHLIVAKEPSHHEMDR